MHRELQGGDPVAAVRLRCWGAVSVGLARPCSPSWLSLRARTVQEGGRGRKRKQGRARPRMPHLCWSLVSFTLHREAGEVPVLIPIRQTRSRAQRGHPAGDSSGALGETDTTPAQGQPGGDCRCPRSLLHPPHLPSLSRSPEAGTAASTSLPRQDRPASRDPLLRAACE